MTERMLWIWFSRRTAGWARAAAALIERFGGPAQVYAAERSDFLQCSFLRKAQVDALCDKDIREAEEILRQCERGHIEVVALDDARYPERLKQIEDPPPVLYVRGTLPDFEARPAVAIVGTRECTAYGFRQAKKFGAALAEAGFLVVTGMARGIDGAANRGALNADKPTVAVLAGGVDRCYPLEHTDLMNDIMRTGAVLSEQPPGTPNFGRLFPVRNRIISGLCSAVFVIEAPANSGALITAAQAEAQGRPVFVLPGMVDNDRCAGSNRLMKQGGADIVLDPMDLVHALGSELREMPDAARVRAIYLRESGGIAPSGQEPMPPAEAASKPKKSKKEASDGEKRPWRMNKGSQIPTVEELLERPKPTVQEISGDELLVARAMQQGAKTPDEIIRISGLSSHRALSALTMLEMDGLVKGTSTEVWLVDKRKTPILEERECQN